MASAAPALAGLALGAVVLGPGLGRGFLLSYDMVFVPHPPLTATALGLAGSPPRAVPSDAVVAVLAHVLPSDVVQKIVLLSIFMLSCWGAATLLRGRPLPARLAAGVFYAWNPYVGERLILGQWALLLGYAGLPWVVRAVADGPVGWRGTGRLFAALAPAAIGGFAAMSVSALAAVPVALSAPPSRAHRVRAAAVVVLMLGVLSLPWLIPSLARPVHTSPAGVAAFAARADTPFGSLGSLLLLGGTWNAQTVPKGYGGPSSWLWLILALTGVIGYASGLRGRRHGPDAGIPMHRDAWWPGLGIAAIIGFAIACAGITGPGQAMLRGLIGLWPGFAVVRDGQQFVAPLALVEAAGIGAFAAWCASKRQPFGIRGERRVRAGRSDPLAVAVTAAVAVLPLVLLPGLAWGAAGRLRPAEYPADWLRARAVIDADPAPGAALLLPWGAYRRPGWNHGEAVLDPWPRLLGRTVIWDDAVVVGNLVVSAESPPARRLTGVVTSAGPLVGPLRAAGIRYVIVDAGLDGPRDGVGGSVLPPSSLRRRLAGSTVVFTGPDVAVYRLGRG